MKKAFCICTILSLLASCQGIHYVNKSNIDYSKYPIAYIAEFDNALGVNVEDLDKWTLAFQENLYKSSDFKEIRNYTDPPDSTFHPNATIHLVVTNVEETTINEEGCDNDKFTVAINIACTIKLMNPDSSITETTVFENGSAEQTFCNIFVDKKNVRENAVEDCINYLANYFLKDLAL